ncbi:MAG: oxidoreductase [Luteibaculum sp.]
MAKRTWLITGISSGLGRSITQSAMDAGDYVIGTFRQKAQVDDFNLQHKGIAEAFLLDLTSQTQIENLALEIQQRNLKVDVLVNNAGIGFVGAIEESSMEELRHVFEANFFGSFRLTQLILPMMQAEGKGKIVQISSHGGFKAFAGFGVYNASKFALEGFSEALAQEIAPLGIKVCIVEPGPFRTEFAGAKLVEAKRQIPAYQANAGAFRKKLKSVHGKQEGDPKKAAEAILKWVDEELDVLRLPLGKIALNSLNSKLQSVAQDLEKSTSIATGAVFS